MYSGDYEPVPYPPVKPVPQPDPEPSEEKPPTTVSNESDGEG